MRILFATLGYKPAYRLGGPIHSVSATAERLVRRGHEVSVFATNSNLDEDLDVPVDRPVDISGVKVWYFARQSPLKKSLPFISYFSKSTGYLYAPRLDGELRKIISNVDLVHTHLPFIYPSFAVARSAIRHRIPLFYHQRGLYDPARLKFRTLKKTLYLAAVECPIMRRATALFALTEAERRSYRALGIHTRCHVLPNGVEVREYRQVPRTDCCVRWGIPADASVVLFLARLHPVKGVDTLLEAFFSVAGSLPKAFLVLAGPDEWGIKGKVAEMSQQAGLGHRILMTGLVEGEEKLDLLARADLFCLPSIAEGFSMAVLEAMASGTPVLLSEGCYFPEVEAVRAGVIHAEGVPALSAALAGLLRAPEDLKEMGRRALNLVAEKYTWDSVVDRLIDYYVQDTSRRCSELSGDER